MNEFEDSWSGDSGNSSDFYRDAQYMLKALHLHALVHLFAQLDQRIPLSYAQRRLHVTSASGPALSTTCNADTEVSVPAGVATAVTDDDTPVATAAGGTPPYEFDVDPTAVISLTTFL